jgi:hypothetical protein
MMPLKAGTGPAGKGGIRMSDSLYNDALYGDSRYRHIPYPRLAKWLRIAVILTAAFGAAVFFGAVPIFGQSIVYSNPEFAYCYIPWLAVIWCTAVPCYAALVFAWRIAKDIGREHPFTHDNARRVRRIGQLAIADVAFFFAANVVLLFLNMNHPGILLMALFICLAGVAFAVVVIALAHLVGRAAELQEDSDLTI